MSCSINWNDPKLYSPDPRKRWDRACQLAYKCKGQVKRLIARRFRDWPPYWRGAANAWLVFLGPSPGGSPGRQSSEEIQLPVLGKPQKDFAEYQDTRGFWDFLREWTIHSYQLANVFPQDNKAPLGVTLNANIIPEQSGSATKFSLEKVSQEMTRVVANLWLLRPRIVVTLHKTRVWQPFLDELSKIGTMIPNHTDEMQVKALNQKYEYYRPKFCEVDTSYGPLLVAQAPQHPSKRNFINIDDASEYLANLISLCL